MSHQKNVLIQVDKGLIATEGILMGASHGGSFNLLCGILSSLKFVEVHFQCHCVLDVITIAKEGGERGTSTIRGMPDQSISP